MGLSVYDAAMLAELVRHLPRRRTVVCLGMPHLRFTARSLERWSRRIGGTWSAGADPHRSLDGPAFFQSLGFERCLALDISDYEGAQIIHDLNDPNLPLSHYGVADCVVDAGTLEHVFQLPNAFGNIFRLLAVDGLVVHTTPANGYLDHGFYQISPTLYYDYYVANQHRIISANVINRHPRVRCEPYVEDIYRNRGTLYSAERLPRATVFFAAQKTAESTTGKVPTQGYYDKMHSGTERPRQNEFPFTYTGPRAGFGSKVGSLARGAGRRLKGLLSRGGS